MPDLPSVKSVKNAKLTLIAFQLRNSLASGNQPLETANHLWEKCQEIGKTCNFPQLKHFINQLNGTQGYIGFSPDEDDRFNDYVELLTPDRFVGFHGSLEANQPQLKGEVYPVQLHDIYAIDITFRRPEAVVSVTDIQKFLNPNYCLLPSFIQSDLGQILIFFAEPIPSKDHQEFAKYCVQALFPESETKRLLENHPLEGKFLGSPIFEYQTGESNPEQQINLLIWLSQSVETQQLEEKGDYYQPLLNLFCCRQKIFYSYTQSRRCYQQAKQLYKTLLKKSENIQNLSPNIRDNLQFLKQELVTIPELSFQYVNNIQQIKLQLNTIETNLKNYQKCLEKLNLLIVSEDDLSFLSEFKNRTQDKFIEQIYVDLEYLIPGKDLFSELINTIWGLVDIEQAECDRSLEQTITMLGAGLGAGGIMASAISGHVEQDFIIKTENSQTVLNPGIVTLLLSFLAALIVGGTVGLINGKISPKFKSPKNN